MRFAGLIKRQSSSVSLIERTSRENRELIERIHRDLATSLGDVRERLAHIEGHLRITPPPTTANDTTAEAA